MDLHRGGGGYAAKAPFIVSGHLRQTRRSRPAQGVFPGGVGFGESEGAEARGQGGLVEYRTEPGLSGSFLT